MFLKLFGIVLLASLGIPAFADSAPHWLEVRTDHFTVVTDAGDRRARDTAAQLERMRDLFAKLLPHATDDTGSRIVVLALRNRKDFQTVGPAAYLAKNSIDLAGLFLSGQDRSYILLRLDTEGEHPYSTVYHEYTHYLNRHDQTMPLWLNEGLAEFFQNTDLDARMARMGQPSGNAIGFLHQQRLLPLSTLFAVDHSSPYYHEENKGNIFYAEAWALTHMLFIQDFQNRTNKLQQYLTYVAKGEDSVAAAQHAFGDLKVLERALDSYLNLNSFSLLRMPLQNTIQEEALNVQPIATADADALRADILLRNGREEEAKALLEVVLKQAPGNAQAHESMGSMELRRGNLLEARNWYGQAVALHSTSYLTYFYFGSLSLHLGHMRPDDPSDDAIGAALHQALQLNPQFAPACEALARLDTRTDQLDEAVQMMRNAVQLDPSNISYRLDAAQIRVQRKEFTNAISILKVAQGVAQTAQDRERVQARLASLQRYQAQLDAAKQDDAAPGQPAVTAVTSVSGFGSESSGNGDRAADGIPAESPASSSWSEHNFPAGPPTGPRHTVKGVIHNVACFYPKNIMLDVDAVDSRKLVLYSNDMYEVHYTALNFKPAKVLNPCGEIEGLKANVVYAEGDGKKVAGQIVSIEFMK